MSHEDVPKPATAPRYPRPPRLAVSVFEAAESLGISVGLLYKEIGAGRIRVCKVSGRTLVPLSELARIVG
jgi:hypothetical protein